MDVNGGAKVLENNGEIGDRGRSRSESGESEEPEAGDENTVFARLNAVGAGEGSRSVPAGRGCAPSSLLEAKTGAVGLVFREGGRGRGLDRCVEANSSVNVGKTLLVGVVGIRVPFAFPSPLRINGEDGV